LFAGQAIRIIRANPSTTVWSIRHDMSDTPHYEIEARGDTEATVRVTVNPDAFREQLDAVYRRYAREARIPGFRKGKIPRNVLDSRFGRDLFLAEAQEDLQRRHLPEALESLDLRPVSRPQLEIVSFGTSDPFVFTASFSVLPQVSLPGIRERQVTVPSPPPVTEEDVQQALRDVQSHFATLQEKAGDTAEDGDIVRIREGENEWDTRVDGDDPVTSRLAGAQVGERVEIDAEAPGGKRLQTTLDVVSLKQIVLPEIDDEMAKDAGFDSLDALKSDIEEKIAAARADRHDRLIESAALDSIVDEAGISLPEPFVDELVDEELERFRTSFDEPGSERTFDGYLAERGIGEDQLRDEIRRSVERRLRRELVLRRIATDEGIRIEDEELETLAREDAEEAGEDPLRFAARLKAEDRWGDYRASKVNERVLAILRETAVVSDAKAGGAERRIIVPSDGRDAGGLVIDPTKEGGDR